MIDLLESLLGSTYKEINSRITNKHKKIGRIMKLLDLFSGIGGFSLAAKWAGMDTIQFVEKDLFCQKVLTKNFPGVPIHDDIKTFSCNQQVDIITGGFPCQPFSIAGKKKGKDDERYLWPEFYRQIVECLPHYVVIENVYNLINMGIEDMLIQMETLGYRSGIFSIPACGAQAPHRRERLWIVAYRDSERCNMRRDYWQTGYLQDYKNRYREEIQQEWSQFKPESWSTYTAQDWFTYNASTSRSYDGISGRMDKDRIKSLGNSIVPQVVYPILRNIYLLEQYIKTPDSPTQAQY